MAAAEGKAQRDGRGGKEGRDMGMFLNSIAPFEEYRDIAGNRFFVDKSDMLDEIIDMAMAGGEKYLCFTRPRRFGKSVMANMVAAFFGRAGNGEEIFRTLKIAQSDNYPKYLSSYNVIYIDFSRLPEQCNSYDIYINRISDGIKTDLIQEYPGINLDVNRAVWDNLQMIYEQERTRFIFVMDEWDAIFHRSFVTEDNKKDYLEFLRNLLKGQAYVGLAYMTGVLPIGKYSSGSEMNMFIEYDMVTRVKFSEYFGFLDSEVDSLFDVYRKNTKYPQITRERLTEWYDGYHTAAGARLYNPRSVIGALTNNQISSYWTSSGPYDEIFYYIRNNIQDIRDDLVLMISGGRVAIEFLGYAATSQELYTKNQIYSAMVVYGLLTCEDGEVFIPNRELMDKYDELLLTNENLGYVYNLAKESERMLKATLSGDTETMAEILKLAHDTESPIFSYNSEIELSAVVNLVYLSARDKYRVEREEKAGEGYVDFIFYPERKGADALILELKVDDTPEQAIRQIRDRNYALRFKGKVGEKPKYTGRILAVGIGYDRKTKEHACKVETL